MRLERITVTRTAYQLLLEWSAEHGQGDWVALVPSELQHHVIVEIEDALLHALNMIDDDPTKAIDYLTRVSRSGLLLKRGRR
jgi:hypothetical protein